ncbi:MAG: hypothetical protein ABIB79_04870 [archaeon]
MYKNNRGLSTVITTLIIVLLVLVAIGIIWVVIRNVIEEAGEDVTAKGECIGAQVNIKSITCTSGGASCDVIVERLSGGGDSIDGVKVTVSDGANSLTQTTSGGLDILDVVTVSVVGGNLDDNVALAVTINAAPILDDGTICDTIDTDDFSVDTLT